MCQPWSAHDALNQQLKKIPFFSFVSRKWDKKTFFGLKILMMKNHITPASWNCVFPENLFLVFILFTYKTVYFLLRYTTWSTIPVLGQIVNSLQFEISFLTKITTNTKLSVSFPLFLLVEKNRKWNLKIPAEILITYLQHKLEFKRQANNFSCCKQTNQNL